MQSEASDQSTYLEHVPGDDVKPLVVVGDSFEVRVVAKDHLKYLQEELKRVLVEEVDLCVCVCVCVCVYVYVYVCVRVHVGGGECMSLPVFFAIQTCRSSLGGAV